MAPREIQQKNEQQLRVIQIDQNQFYVESQDGKICYKVHIEKDRESCTCENFQKISKSDNSFRCNHILAVENCTPDCAEIETVEHAEKIRKPKLDERFIKSIEGRDFVLYSGLLDLAHQKGLSKISVQILQFPTPENKNWAIVMATVESSHGIFSDVGDASTENCNFKISKHLIRMASTRAKARALRDLTNIGMTCLEELSDINEAIDDNPPQREKPAKEKSERTRKPRDKESSRNEKSNTSPAPEANKDPSGQNLTNSTPRNNTPVIPQPKMSNAQKRALENLSRRKGISMEELNKMTIEMFNSEFDYLSSNDASALIFQLQQHTA